MNEPLPRICYVGPAIGPSVGGPAILFKLLHGYPADRLLAVQTRMGMRMAEEGASGSQVVWVPWPPGSAGPRVHTLYGLTFLFGRSIWASWIRRKVRGFKFDAVVSVVHGWLCEPALQVAQRHGVPFHAILHDHADAALAAPRRMGEYRLKRWRQLCERSASRLCVSPFMAEEVERLTRCRCEVLYPGLSPAASLSAWHPPEITSTRGELVFSFAGLIHSGFRSLMLRFGKVLSACGHRLVLHSPQAPHLLAGSPPEALTDGGWIPTAAVAETLRQEADALFLPVSFEPNDESNTRVLFPSKLVEYWAAGRPSLIWGPPYSSAVRWAKQHPGFAEVVESNEEEDVRLAVQRLAASCLQRQEMGMRSLHLAREYFSHPKTFGKFLEILRRGHSRPPMRHSAGVLSDAL